MEESQRDCREDNFVFPTSADQLLSRYFKGYSDSGFAGS